MKTFLDFVSSNMPAGQAAVLQRFLDDINSGRVPGNPGEVEALLDGVGQLLSMPAGEVTDPEVFNQSIRTLISNISGLYYEIDQLDMTQAGMESLNDAELTRFENSLKDIATVTSATKRVHSSRFNPTDTFFESFSGEALHETDGEWFFPTPQLEETTRIGAFLPAYIDPDDKSLKLAPGGSFSRTLSSEGLVLVQAEVEEILGLPIDMQHGVSNALDGQVSSYWRELLIAESPIDADPLQVPWLPDTYTGGAAVRVHFRYPFAVPFSELLIHSFSSFPAKALQVVWDNRKQVQYNLVSNGDFLSGSSNWTVTYPSTATSGVSDSGGYDYKGQLYFTMYGGVAYATNRTLSTTGSRIACHLLLKAKYRDAIRLYTYVTWKTSGGVTLRTDRVEMQGPEDEWFEYSKLFIPPSGWVSGSQTVVTLVSEGSGNAYFSDVKLSPVVGWWNSEVGPDPESDLITVPTPVGHATDLWLVMSQPHYEFKQFNVPDGDLDQQELWDEVVVNINGQNEGVHRFVTSQWALEKGGRTGQEIKLPTQNSTMLDELRRLGGRAKELFSQLSKYTNPSKNTTPVNRYLYTIGAREIRIRHREYATHGLYVSKPFNPRGEVREIKILTNPSISELGDDVRFWITAKDTDGLDKALAFTGQVRFYSSTERIPTTTITHFVLPPVQRREVFEGTDRYGVLELSNHPFFDTDRATRLQTALTSGSLSWPLLYESNKGQYNLYVSGSPWSKVSNSTYTVRKIVGYRPIKVWLEFDDGVKAQPDILGAILPGDIGYSGLDTLELVEVERDKPDKDHRRRKIKPRARKPLFGSRVGHNNRDGRFTWRDHQDHNLGSLKTRRKIKVRGRWRRDRERDEDEGRRRKRRPIPNTHSRVTQIRGELHTRFRNIVAGPEGAALSLYIHKSADITSGNVIVSGDVLIPPTHYEIDAEEGVITVHIKPPNGNPDYDSFIAYYYFFRDENQREEFDVSALRTLPVSGVDTSGEHAQSYPVTRNMTDYVYGTTPDLQPPQLDRLLPDYYPVYEYYITPRGELKFAENFHIYSETPARITVEYESLLIEPRLIIEFPKRTLAAVTSRTPIIKDYTLLMQARH